MAKDASKITIPKMNRREAFQQARDILHGQGMSHENERLFQQATALIIAGWDHLGVIDD